MLTARVGRHFPGGAVAETSRSQHAGPGSIPGRGTRPHLQQLKNLCGTTKTQAAK